MSALPLVQSTSTPLPKFGPTQQKIYDRAIKLFKSGETDLDKVKRDLWFDNMAAVGEKKEPVYKVVDRAWLDFSAALVQLTAPVDGHTNGHSAEADISAVATIQPTAPINNEAGQVVVTFRKRAQILVERGLLFTALMPKTKIAFIDEWQNKTFKTVEDAEKFGLDVDADYNTGVVAKAEIGGTWFFEVDDRAVIKQVQTETGQKMPKTLTIKSSEGKAHFYFKQNLSSIETGNIPQKYGPWSARINDQYVVGPLSQREKADEPGYEIIVDAPIVEAPEWLLSWLKARKITKTEETKPAGAPKQLTPHGKIHSWLCSRAGELRANGLEVQEIETVLLREVFENCEAPIDESRVVQVARSMSNYKQGPSRTLVLIDGKLPATVETEPVDVREETGIEDIEEKLPEFPRFSGLLSELCEVICPDLPYEFKFMAAVTHWGLMRSGLDTLENEPHLQPRFYTCLVAMPGTGKTGSINEIRKVLTILNPNYVFTTSVDSGPALVDEFVDFTRTMSLRLIGQDSKNATQDKSSRVLLDPDEMADLFEKSKMTAQSRNSLSQELLKLYESNRTGNRSRKAGKSQVDNAHLAILAGATPEGYERMWAGTGGGSTGLQSRVVPISTAAGKMGVEKKATNFEALKFYVDELIALANRPNQVISLDSDAKRMLQDWWGSDRTKPSESRVDDMVKRLVIVLAVTNDVLVVGPDLMAQAIKFGDYVIAAREKYNPSDSHSWTQAFEQAIIKVGQKRKVSMTMAEYRRLVNPSRKPGGFASFLQAWKTLIQVGVLKAGGATHKGTVKYRI